MTESVKNLLVDFLRYTIKRQIGSVRPKDAVPARYDKKGVRVSPDIEEFEADGIWYRGDGTRDEQRSPKEKIVGK